jgi:hypothetical protein
LEQDEARSGQHALLCGEQAPAGVSIRQVADYLDDLGQITRRRLSRFALYRRIGA